MTRHLQNKHPELAKELVTKRVMDDSKPNQDQPKIKIAFSKQNALPPDSIRSRNITNAIALMLAADLQPYSVVEDTGFTNLMRVLEPRYQMPCRTTFSRTLIPKLYLEESIKIAGIISNDTVKGIVGLRD